MGFLSRLRNGLARTRQSLMGRLEALVGRAARMDEEWLEELEAVLIQADMGAATAASLVEELRRAVGSRPAGPAEVKARLRERLLARLGPDGRTVNLDGQPAVVLVVGVNGTGKTTTVAKLAHLWRRDGKRVLVAAADTFRAAGIEQLEIWARRAGVEVVKQREGADPAAVVFDAVQAARARRADVVIVDTAGRLHTKRNLMEELAKIRRVVAREAPGAPHEVLLVLDATTGQNAVSQARLFLDAAGVTGIVLTKLDGTARGGIVVAIQEQLGIPVKFIGVGEDLEDLQPFDPARFVEALFD
ncbi:MAG: signal recognition particle-docking protein FtsY [Desulfotomaculales bacterium]